MYWRARESKVSNDESIRDLVCQALNVDLGRKHIETRQWI